jgi:hypothetical protein
VWRIVVRYARKRWDREERAAAALVVVVVVEG